jgi:hypothetical protein
MDTTDATKVTVSLLNRNDELLDLLDLVFFSLLLLQTNLLTHLLRIHYRHDVMVWPSF